MPKKTLNYIVMHTIVGAYKMNDVVDGTDLKNRDYDVAFLVRSGAIIPTTLEVTPRSDTDKLTLHESVDQGVLVKKGLVEDPATVEEEDEDEEEEDSEESDTPEYSSMKVPELRLLAEEKGIEGFAKMGKADLVTALQESESE